MALNFGPTEQSPRQPITIIPWTFRPHQAELIRNDESVRITLARLSRHFFAGTDLKPTSSSFVLGEDPAQREWLRGQHSFSNGELVVTQHELHIVFANKVPGDYASEDDGTSHESYILLESLYPHSYISCLVTRAADVTAIEKLMCADTRDIAFVQRSSVEN